jgi:hypothetical protein
METVTPGILTYLLVAWGVVTAVFIVMFIRRSLLESHEDDQIFLDAAGDQMAAEQRALVAKIMAMSRPLLALGIASGSLLLVMAGVWLYEGLKSF